MQRMSRPTDLRFFLGLNILLMAALPACLGKKIVHGGKSAGSSAQEEVRPDALPQGSDGTKPAGSGLSTPPAICRELEKACAPGGAATFCELPEIAGTLLMVGSRPHSFGANECEARKGVLEQACKRGMDVKAMDAIKCRADASGRRCPVAPRMCIALFDPARCSAAKYGGEAVAAGVLLSGWGANECVARGELEKITCAQNLNPDLVQGVSCARQTRYRADCPPLQPTCDAGDNKTHTCEVDLPAVPSTKLSAEGAGKCVARFNLEMRICLAGHSPAELSQQVTCRQK